MKERVAKVREVMKEKELPALLIDSEINRFYLTGFTGTSGRVLFTPDHNYFITDFRYREQAEREIDGFEVLEINRDMIDRIGGLLRKEKIKSLGFEAREVSYYLLEKYRDKLPVELLPTTNLVAKLRMIKEEMEVERIKKAIEIAEAAFKHIIDFIEPGLREREISLELEYYMKNHGGEENSFTFIVASGARASLPHGTAGIKRVERGDLIIMDYGTKYRGYCSDITRTIVVGPATEKQRKIYNIVLRAHREVTEGIRAGLTGKEADNIARKIIEEAGYADNFGHGVGHGLGLEIHEAPRVSYNSEEELQPGMVVTDEPGIYLPGWGGVRIEDNLLITEDGCRVLNNLTRELIEL